VEFLSFLFFLGVFVVVVVQHRIVLSESVYLVVSNKYKVVLTIAIRVNRQKDKL